MPPAEILTVVSLVVTALTGAIATLWRIVIKRANSCEEKHEKTQGELLTVTKEVGELKGRIHIAEQIAPTLNEIKETLSKKK